MERMSHTDTDGWIYFLSGDRVKSPIGSHRFENNRLDIVSDM